MLSFLNWRFRDLKKIAKRGKLKDSNRLKRDRANRVDYEVHKAIKALKKHGCWGTQSMEKWIFNHKIMVDFLAKCIKDGLLVKTEKMQVNTDVRYHVKVTLE